jgi:hypothetical protein
VTLVRICCEHRHAVERDLISLGFHGFEDLGKRLTLWQLNSIVWGSPPGSAVYHAETRNGTYSQTDQILAGIAPNNCSPTGTYPATKVDELAGLPDWCPPGSKTVFSLDAMPVDELRTLREQKRTELLAQLGKNET